jgi:hypothetical protein
LKSHAAQSLTSRARAEPTGSTGPAETTTWPEAAGTRAARTRAAASGAESACVESFRSIEWISRTVAIEPPTKRKGVARARVSERGDRIGRCVNGESRGQKWRRRGLRRFVRPSVIPPSGRHGIRD